MATQPTGGRARQFWLLLLVPAVIVPLIVPIYNSVNPELAGIPFFYWFQFLWIIVSSVLIGIVYFAVRDRQTPTSK